MYPVSLVASLHKVRLCKHTMMQGDALSECINLQLDNTEEIRLSTRLLLPPIIITYMYSMHSCF